MKYTDRSPSGTLFLWMTLCTFGLFALSSFGGGALYIICATDVTVSGTILPILIDFSVKLIQTVLIPALAWALICFAEFGKNLPKLARSLFLLYLGSLLFCRLLDLSVSLVFWGSLDAEEIIFAGWYLMLDLIFAEILYAILRHRANRYAKENQLAVKAAAALNREESVKITPNALYPFPKKWDRSNPLQSCPILFAMILSSVKVAQRIFYDVAYSIDGASLPSLEEIPVMAIYYLSDLLTGLFFLLIVYFVFFILDRKNKKCAS